MTVATAFGVISGGSASAGDLGVRGFGPNRRSRHRAGPDCSRPTSVSSGNTCAELSGAPMIFSARPGLL